MCKICDLALSVTESWRDSEGEGTEALVILGTVISANVDDSDNADCIATCEAVMESATMEEKLAALKLAAKLEEYLQKFTRNTALWMVAHGQSVADDEIVIAAVTTDGRVIDPTSGDEVEIPDELRQRMEDDGAIKPRRKDKAQEIGDALDELFRGGPKRRRRPMES
jgi:hypothetical protein